MFKTISPLLTALAALLFLASCENTSNDVEPNDENTEFKHIRLLISDENSTELSLVNPYTNEVQSFDA